MGKVRIASIFIVIASSCLTAQGDLIWAKQFEGPGFGLAADIAVDSSGNVFTIGELQGTIDFDPGPGELNLISTVGSSFRDVFITKQDSNGDLVWALSFGADSWDEGYAIAVDDAGFIYATGSNRGSVDFDPSPAVVPLGNPDSTLDNIFVLKLDTDGNLIWGKSLNGNPGVQPTVILELDLALDSSGSIYLGGSFVGTLDVDPGAETYPLHADLGANGFVCKLDLNGNFIFASAIEGDSITLLSEIAVDNANAVYATGNFRGLTDFDPGFGEFQYDSIDHSDIFVWKLANDGTLAWAKAFPGTLDSTGSDIAVDADGNVYHTGLFQATVDFDPTNAVSDATSQGSFDGYLSKLDPSGNLDWTTTFGSTADEAVLGLTLDPLSGLYITGAFSDSVDFDPGPGEAILTTSGIGTFITHIETTGTFVWTQGVVGNGTAIGRSIRVDPTGNVHVFGDFQGTFDFDPGEETTNLTSNAQDDLFVLKFFVQGPIPEEPIITSAPQPGFIEEGRSLTLTGPDSGTDYIWYRDEVPILNDPPRVTGADTQVLVFAPVALDDSGVYTVTFDDGAKAPVESNPLLIEVLVTGSLPVAGFTALVILGGSLLTTAGYARRKRYE